MTKKNKTPEEEPDVDSLETSEERTDTLSNLFWILLIGGAVLRLLNLGLSSYMIDEVNIIREAVQQESIKAIYATEMERFTWYHRLPLMMAILHVVIGFVGFSGPFPPEWVARLPSALIGVATLPMMYLFGVSVRDRRTGLWLMFLATISIFHIYYSREAYDYAPLMFCSTGLLWSSVELLKHWHAKHELRPPRMLAYIFFSTVLLQIHLSGLLFIAPWNALMAISLWRDKDSRDALNGANLLKWIVVFGVAYMLFLPFILKLLGGFATTESPYAKRFSLGVFPTLIGCMGWGAGWFVLMPFVLLLGVGLFTVIKQRGESSNKLLNLLFLQLAAYFLIQTWSLRVSRFETRYYSALFPLLLLGVSIGLTGVVKLVADRLSLPRKPAAVFIVAVLLFWHYPSLEALVKLDCRGASYKAIAEWVNTELPDNGIYGYWNVYDLRGTPSVYPTPGRFPAYPVPWSNADDYRKYQVYERLVSFYRRFPLAHHIEIIPQDIFAPELVENKPIPRDELFMNQTWLESKYFQKLLKRKTWPSGDAQWESKFSDRILISYNEPEDLPKLAAKRGEKLYQYFGPEWRYAKDQQMNDWRVAVQSARIIIGNITSAPVPANIRISCMAPPNGCRLSMYAPNGMQVADKIEIPGQYYELNIPTVGLAPGENTLFLDVLPMPGEAQAQLLVYAVLAEEAQAPPPAQPAATSAPVDEAPVDQVDEAVTPTESAGE